MKNALFAAVAVAICAAVLALVVLTAWVGYDTYRIHQESERVNRMIVHYAEKE